MVSQEVTGASRGGDPRHYSHAVPANVDLANEEGLGPITSQPFPAGFTLIDLRPLRSLFSAARTKKSDPEIMRIVHGFDAILVLTGSHPSQMLP